MKHIATVIIATVIGSSAFAQTPTPSPTPVPFAGWIVSGTGNVVVPTRQAPVPASPGYVSGTIRPSAAQIALAQARTKAWNTVNKGYWTTIGSGIAATSGSLTLTLPASKQDAAALSQLLQTYSTAAMPATATLADVSGSAYTVSVSQLYQLVGSYEAQLAALNASLATARANVLTSGTAVLPNITLANVTGTAVVTGS